jgi:ribosomal protein S18 acetylase RimI-like enzyme
VDVAITRAGAEALDRLQALWLELHHHHQAVGGPALGPYVDDDASWTACRATYARLLARDGFVVLAERGDDLVGYALVAVMPATETILDDTWRTGESIAEIETVCVAPSERGRGIGTALLDRVDEELEAAGIADVLIGAVATNTDAIRLYERRGFRPAWLYLTRLAGRT